MVIWNRELYHGKDRSAYYKWYYQNYTKKGRKIGKKEPELVEGKDYRINPQGDIYSIHTKELITPRDFLPDWYEKREWYNEKSMLPRQKITKGSDYDPRYYNFDKETAWRRNKLGLGSKNHYMDKKGKVRKLPFNKLVTDIEGNGLVRMLHRGKQRSVGLNPAENVYIKSMKDSGMFSPDVVPKVFARKVRSIKLNNRFRLTPMGSKHPSRVKKDYQSTLYKKGKRNRYNWADYFSIFG